MGGSAVGAQPGVAPRRGSAGRAGCAGTRSPPPGVEARLAPLPAAVSAWSSTASANAGSWPERSTASGTAAVEGAALGWRQRASASARDDLAGAQVDDRLELDDELAFGDRPGQVAAEREPAEVGGVLGGAYVAIRWPSRFAWYIATSARRSSSSIAAAAGGGRRCRRWPRR